MAERILTCGACLRRALQLVPQQRPSLESAALLQARSLRQASRAFASTIATESSPATSPVKNTDTPSSLDAEPMDETVAGKKAQLKLQRAVKKQLQYMDDPWKIGQYVEQALARDRYDEALLLTQTASRSHQVVVSWNHLINYTLEKQQLHKAVKLYNDMKKRAQLPNLQTYTIMFRGFAKSQHPKLAVAEALKHYNKLLKDTRLEPNSIHLNAVINVCGRAGDLDSMFSVVDSINDSTRSATAYTYTTIINALRFHAMDEVKDLPVEQKATNLKNSIQRGKAVWEEAVNRWRQGRLVIDEELVCAMGRLLLLTPDRADRREILDLIEQTMNIPNLSKAPPASEHDPGLDNSGSRKVARKEGHGTYASPGTNTLALVLTVVASSRLSTSGIKYWNLLVREHNVVPDLDSWMRLFGMLKTAKASAHASEILAIIPEKYINPRFYHMAMEACIRDNISPNAIKHANRALDSMNERLKVPDPHALRLYLQASQASHYHFRARAEGGDVEGAKRDYGIQITEALARMWKPYLNLHNRFFKASRAETDEEKKALYNNKREVIALARIMYSSYNRVIQQEMLPEADLKEIRPIGARINREIQAFFSSRNETEPNLRQAKGRGTAGGDMSEYNDDLDDGLFWDTRQAGKPRRREGFEQRSRRPDRRHDNHKPAFDRGRTPPPSRDPRQRRAPVEW
ncbi:Pentatricopeptide repeat-containing [Fusarium albosuccineum]|uniref:Pentatricopeptide repeat-containing n=1 Tax=Fusarium albosuccineum TaxID=1237068 RepID=A0A8H4L0Q4_9HYPO|nr:Pentatricopeptide repeat-containing [Fusarium albosuccineum]